MQIYRHLTWDNRFLPSNPGVFTVGHRSWSKAGFAGLGGFPISPATPLSHFTVLKCPRCTRDASFQPTHIGKNGRNLGKAWSDSFPENI